MTAKQLLRDGAVVAGGYAARLRRVSPPAKSSCSTTSRMLRVQQCIHWLLERYKIVPVGDLLMDPNLDTRDRLALTFDDGYADWHEVVAPILQRHRCAATFFVSSGFVGLSPSQARTFRLERLRRSRELAPLTVSQLRDLAAENLFEIGSHTVSHRDLGVPLPPQVWPLRSREIAIVSRIGPAGRCDGSHTRSEVNATFPLKPLGTFGEPAFAAPSPRCPGQSTVRATLFFCRAKASTSFVLRGCGPLASMAAMTFSSA